LTFWQSTFWQSTFWQSTFWQSTFWQSTFWQSTFWQSTFWQLTVDNENFNSLHFRSRHFDSRQSTKSALQRNTTWKCGPVRPVIISQVASAHPWTFPSTLFMFAEGRKKDAANSFQSISSSNFRRWRFRMQNRYSFFTAFELPTKNSHPGPILWNRFGQNLRIICTYFAQI
jgi:hypothetical protein